MIVRKFNYFLLFFLLLILVLMIHFSYFYKSDGSVGEKKIKIENKKLRIQSDWTQKDSQFYSKMSCIGIDPDSDIVAVERRSCIFENICLNM